MTETVSTSWYRGRGSSRSTDVVVAGDGAFVVAAGTSGRGATAAITLHDNVGARRVRFVGDV